MENLEQTINRGNRINKAIRKCFVAEPFHSKLIKGKEKTYRRLQDMLTENIASFK